MKRIRLLPVLFVFVAAFFAFAYVVQPLLWLRGELRRVTRRVTKIDDSVDSMPITTSTPPLKALEVDGDAHFALVTVDTKNALRAKTRWFLQESALKQGIPLNVLGVGRKFIGYGTKLKVLRDALLSYRQTQPAIWPRLHLLVVDASDVALFCSAPELVRRFRSSFNDSVLFNAELTCCWPLNELESYFPPAATPYRYLNSGVLFGRASLVLQLLDFDENEQSIEVLDDQFYYSARFLAQSSPLMRLMIGGRSEYHMQLDSNCSLFQTMVGSFAHVRFEDGRLRNDLTRTEPCFLHGPGGSRQTFNELVIKELTKDL